MLNAEVFSYRWMSLLLCSGFALNACSSIYQLTDAPGPDNVSFRQAATFFQERECTIAFLDQPPVQAIRIAVSKDSTRWTDALSNRGGICPTTQVACISCIDRSRGFFEGLAVGLGIALIATPTSGGSGQMLPGLQRSFTVLACITPCAVLGGVQGHTYQYVLSMRN